MRVTIASSQLLFGVWQVFATSRVSIDSSGRISADKLDIAASRKRWRPTIRKAYVQETGRPAFGNACTTGFCSATAVRYWNMSMISFCSKQAVESWSCGDMCNNVRAEPEAAVFISGGQICATDGFVKRVTGDGVCVLAFRGTSSLKNFGCNRKYKRQRWPRDNSRPGTVCPGCLVHEGFQTAYEEIRDSVIEGLKRLECKRVVATGHGSGAAVATLAALDLHVASRFGYGRIRVDSLWTFGSPVVGNYRFAKFFAERACKTGAGFQSFRIVNAKDWIVTLLGEYGYTHVPTEVAYKTSGMMGYSIRPWDNTRGYGFERAANNSKVKDTSAHRYYMGQTFNIEADKDCITQKELEHRTAVRKIVFASKVEPLL